MVPTDGVELCSWPPAGLRDSEVEQGCFGCPACISPMPRTPAADSTNRPESGTTNQTAATLKFVEYEPIRVDEDPGKLVRRP
ncbi:hypothetical protein [Nocardia sp. NPDC049526]|uniref:hypothetical protein n=1 Tax=Nocardia sp. NPDC049526 TaxID=3364316 RepID=UPI0037AA9B84